MEDEKLTSKEEIKLYETSLKGKIIYSRHGETVANQALYTIGFEEIRYNKDYIDTHLAEKGIEEAEQASKMYLDLDIEGGYVSPLYRTLQTATILFKNHPQRNKIVFKVHPLIIENTADISCAFVDIEKTKNEFNMNSEVKFDWSIFDEYYQTKKEQDTFFIQYLDNINNPEEKEKLLNAYGTKEYVDKLVNYFKLSGNEFPESVQHLFERAQEFKRFLKKTLENSLKDTDKKIIIVSHGAFGTAMTAKECGKDLTFREFLTKGYCLKNVEAISIIL